MKEKIRRSSRKKCKNLDQRQWNTRSTTQTLTTAQTTLLKRRRNLARRREDRIGETDLMCSQSQSKVTIRALSKKK